MRPASISVPFIALFLTGVTSGISAQPNLSPQSTPTFLDQSWNEDDRSWFYTTTQGSQLMPYFWFLALERPDSEKPFLDDQLTRFGYLPSLQTERYKSRNPDGLPIGFVRDDDPERGPWVGMTCAACHTNQISFPKAGSTNEKVLLQIDGGPTGANFFDFLHELSSALNRTLASGEKFDRFAIKIASLSRASAEARGGTALGNRFADRVLSPEFDLAEKARSRRELERFAKNLADYVNVSRTDVAWGPARLDAFGEIFNRATAIDLNLPENNRPPNAPVSYPFLWDTSWHDFVQWNGSAPNQKAVERLARNVGEVLGVFAHTEIKETALPPLYYKTSVDRLNLLLIEQRLRKLTSPQWPTTFSAIDRKQAASGKKHYERYCLSCHAVAVDRNKEIRSLKVTLTPLDQIGTDPLMATNASTRDSVTGILEGVRMPPIFGMPLGAREKSFAVTANIVIGAILAPPEDEKSRVDSLDEVNRKLMRVLQTNRAVKRDLISDRRAMREQGRNIRDIYEQAASFIAGRKDALPLQYKARPLNGIWATAPYLHNGSVPNLYELLLPSTQRSTTFTVGSRELDVKNVGLLSGPNDGPFKFDTSLPGNSNLGHEGADYGTEQGQLSEKERRELLEYLKTL